MKKMLFAFGLAARLASNLPAGKMLQLKLIPDRAVRLKNHRRKLS
jgi:hypothetical protein